MKSKAILMTLAMMSASLAGCTGSDGVTEIDDETLQQLFDDNIQDFMNNTTVDITTVHYNNETSTTTNYINGSGGSSTTMHVRSSSSPVLSVSLYSSFASHLFVSITKITHECGITGISS